MPGPHETPERCEALRELLRAHLAEFHAAPDDAARADIMRRIYEDAGEAFALPIDPALLD